MLCWWNHKREEKIFIWYFFVHIFHSGMDIGSVICQIHIRFSQEIYKDFLFQVSLLLVFQEFLVFKVHTRDFSVIACHRALCHAGGHVGQINAQHLCPPVSVEKKKQPFLPHHCEPCGRCRKAKP